MQKKSEEKNERGMLKLRKQFVRKMKKEKRTTMWFYNNYMEESVYEGRNSPVYRFMTGKTAIPSQKIQIAVNLFLENKKPNLERKRIFNIERIIHDNRF